MKTHLGTLTMVCLAGVSLFSSSPNPLQRAESVSLVNLIADPLNFEGKLVRVIGSGVFEFEQTALYLTSEHAQLGLSRSAVYLYVEGDPPKSETGYFLVAGRFSSKDRGHLASFAGSIEVMRIYPWPPISPCDDLRMTIRNMSEAGKLGAERRRRAQQEFERLNCAPEEADATPIPAKGSQPAQ